MCSRLFALCACWATGFGAPADGGVAIVPFRTESAPRVDAVFADVRTYRARIDKLFALGTEMARVRDEFSSAVHATLGELASAEARKQTGRVCPDAAGKHYGRAAAAGARYLLLGRQVEGRFRDVRRHDELGDTTALTPDYRLKVKKARDLYVEVLRDLREMRIAFHDQLGSEMRHAGCSPPALRAAVAATANAPNPSDPAAWTLASPEESTGDRENTSLPDASPARSGSAATTTAAPAAGASAPAVWIDIDNSRCPEPTRLSIDGAPLGEIASGKRASVRALSGPHEICVLPASDARACGAPGTLRKAYLHDGWSLTVRCTQ